MIWAMGGSCWFKVTCWCGRKRIIDSGPATYLEWWEALQHPSWLLQSAEILENFCRICFRWKHQLIASELRALSSCISCGKKGQLLCNEVDNKAAAFQAHIAWGDHFGHDVHLYFLLYLFDQKGSKVWHLFANEPETWGIPGGSMRHLQASRVHPSIDPYMDMICMDMPDVSQATTEAAVPNPARLLSWGLYPEKWWLEDDPFLLGG